MTKCVTGRRELFAMMAGEYDAELDWLNKLADALDVDVTELFADPDRKQD
ncbi:hypothetical protein [Enhygromyxa salina]|nr:hypothetical protein [Enhygromyxa salina]